ncbi:DUF1572 family protein [Rapidithrix thailandica]|uniref:DUF1572 family protein n=1 Tax=Rapidithrix thailandica TaxID=413964 RepID=A0AAW9SA47_9BACT
MKQTANYLESIRQLFRYYKSLADKAIQQIHDEDIHWQPEGLPNSIAIVVKHMSGNMLSRWTDFLTSDGEKSWRNRDAEFEADFNNKSAMSDYWEKGWKCLFDAIDPLSDEDLQKIVYIRNEGHTVLEAINRQLSHYSYHTGQIVFLAKMICKENWLSLSIPKGDSQSFNREKFSREKQRKHFV